MASRHAAPHILCGACEGIHHSYLVRHTHIPIKMRSSKITIERLSHHKSLENFEDAIRNGCHLCTLVQKTLFTMRKDPRYIPFIIEPEDICTKIEITQGYGPYPDLVLLTFIRIYSEVANANSSIESDHASFAVRPWQDEETRSSAQENEHQKNRIFPVEDGFLAQTNTYTGSDDMFNLCKHWLKDCRTNHGHRCNQPQRDSFVPTRLIDVGQDGDPLLPSLKTMQLANGERIDYLTLSYCWGGASVFKLTAKTEKELINGVALDTLPKTIQDALYATWKLGYRYIWIDSLCIFQDSEADWAREAATMADVYRNSHCAIAALASTDSDGGCFRVRNPLVYKPCRVARLGEVDIYAHMTDLAEGFPEPEEEMSEGPLQKRGWVVQERLLSPRTIFFGSDLVFWECATQGASDLRPLGDRRLTTMDAKMRRFKEVLTAPISYDEQGKHIMASFDWEAWYKAVGYYSACKLTHTSDKLMAVLGIIRGISQKYSLNTVAGLWRERLREELLWITRKPSARPTKYRAPSWTWASIDSEVENIFTSSVKISDEIPEEGPDRREVKWMSEIISANVVPKSPNHEEQGILVGGELVIRGPLFSMASSTLPGDAGFSKFYQDHKEPLALDVNVVLLVHARRAGYPVNKENNLSLDFQQDRIIGLVLQPVQCQGKSAWSRAGLVNWSHGSLQQFPVNTQQITIV